VNVLEILMYNAGIFDVHIWEVGTHVIFLYASLLMLHIQGVLEWLDWT